MSSLLVAVLAVAACLVVGALKAGSAPAAPCTTCTTITLSGPSEITQGDAANITVTVTPTVTGEPTPTGRVTLYDADGGTHGSAKLGSGGSVTIAATSMTAGIWIIHAGWPGDSNYDGNGDASSGSPTITIKVDPQALPQTSTTLSADAKYLQSDGTYEITEGQTINFTATVANTSTSTPPSGTVTFTTDQGCWSPSCPQATVRSDGTATAQAEPPAGTYEVIAMFTGSQYQTSSAQITLKVDPNTTALIDTTTTVLANGGALTVDNGTPVKLVATVTQSHLTIPSSGDKVTFYKTLKGQSQAVLVGDAKITWNGTVGTATYTDTAWDTGDYTIEADFIGFDNLGASSGLGKLSVYQAGSKQPTSLKYIGDTTDWAGQPDNIVFQLLAPNNTPLSGKTVAIGAGGSTYSATTDANGYAAITPKLSLGAGSYALTAHFDGTNDPQYLTSDGSGALQVNMIPTATTVGAITNTNTGASVTLNATLVDTGTSTSPVPLNGKTVTLSFGSDTCSNPTAADGTVSCTISPVTSAPGSYTVKAAFAGDASYLPSDSGDTGNLITVAKGVTTIVDNTTGNFLQGSTVTLSGTLSAYGHALAGEWITLSFGTASCTPSQQTDASGTASCAVTVPGPTGPTTTVASFAGDANYASASNSQPALVYADAPGGGSFVVGDQTAAGSVYFWGAQWWKQNVLSAGDKQAVDPGAFKGFAANPGTPQCGVNWSTNPGNSTPPPAGPLPAYMAVIVTDRNHKAPGKIVSGDTVSIVIVKTDAGYKGDPGHPGTGTVVATICSGGTDDGSSGGVTGGGTGGSVDCTVKGTKCESLLANPSIASGSAVTAGQTVSILFTDDQALAGTPTATFAGSSLPVTVTATSGQKATYVDNYGGSKATKTQLLISFQIPDGYPSGTYPITVTVQDGDGDYDVYTFTVSV